MADDKATRTSKPQTCETCRAFDLTSLNEATNEPLGGLCRRHAPLHLGQEVWLESPDITSGFKRSVWPGVWVGDWCLEHQPAPEAAA